MWNFKFQFIVQSADDIVGAAISRPAHQSDKFESDSGEYVTVYDLIVGANCVRPAV